MDVVAEAADGEAADLCVVNTCTVTGRADFSHGPSTGRGNSNFNHDLVVQKLGSTWTLLSSYWDAGYVTLDVTDPTAATPCPSA